jgi:hypothetical protein
MFGNLHLMDKKEVRIVSHALFYPEDGVSSSDINGFKMINEL